MEKPQLTQLPLFEEAQNAPVAEPAHSDMTPEQEDQIDRLVDQGFNYFQAKTMAGVIITAEAVEPPSVIEPTKSPVHGPRRPLSRHELEVSDRGWPAHIKRW